MSGLDQLNKRIEKAKQKLYDLYAERRELKRAAAKPKRITRKNLAADALSLLRKGWTRDQIAIHYGVKLSTVSAWINGDIFEQAWDKANAILGPEPHHREPGFDEWWARHNTELRRIKLEMRAELNDQRKADKPADAANTVTQTGSR